MSLCGVIHFTGVFYCQPVGMPTASKIYYHEDRPFGGVLYPILGKAGEITRAFGLKFETILSQILY